MVQKIKLKPWEKRLYHSLIRPKMSPNMDRDVRELFTKVAAYENKHDASISKEIVEIIRSNPELVNVSDTQGNTLLHIFADMNQFPMVNFLLEMNAPANKANSLGQYPIHRAVTYRNKRMIEAIYQAFPEINIQTKEGVTPLISAARENLLVNVKMLVERYNADINIPTKSGDLPITEAIKHHNIEMLKYLTEVGTVLEEEFLYYSIYSEHPEGYLYLRRYIDISTNPKLGELLIEAAEHNFPRVILDILENSIPPQEAIKAAILKTEDGSEAQKYLKFYRNILRNHGIYES